MTVTGRGVLSRLPEAWPPWGVADRGLGAGGSDCSVARDCSCWNLTLCQWSRAGAGEGRGVLEGKMREGGGREEDRTGEGLEDVAWLNWMAVEGKGRLENSDGDDLGLLAVSIITLWTA